MSTTKELHIHLGTSPLLNPGDIHLVAAPQDYKELEVFLSSHFSTVGYGDGKAYVCPKGSMFLRDDKGELVRSEGER